MASLKAVAGQGKGKIAVLLPETTTSARYTAFDDPYIRQAFNAAGFPADQVIISNAGGSESTELTQAQTAISQGATVLIMDPISSGVGASIEAYAKMRGVQVIDYDRLTLGGDRSYYVSFDNVAVGKLIGQGMVSCLKDWNVKNPNILVMKGGIVHQGRLKQELTVVWVGKNEGPFELVAGPDGMEGLILNFPVPGGGMPAEVKAAAADARATRVTRH